MSETTVAEVQGNHGVATATPDNQALNKSLHEARDNSAALIANETITNQFVTFAIADEAFGFNMDCVKEIIRIPDTVEVPLTPAALVGLANLRGSVLPVLDMRSVLGLPQQDTTDATRVIVTDMGTQVGLIVDKVLQVTQADESNIDRGKHVSNLVGQELHEGVVRSSHNSDLTQLLNVERLIGAEFQAVLARASHAEQQVNVALNSDEDDVIDQQLVSFTLDNQEFAFDLLDVEEIVRLPDNIASVPKTPSHMLGIMELRQRLLPLLDLRNLFALNSIDESDHTRILVVSTQGTNGQKSQVGLVVDQVREVLRIDDSVRDEVPALLQDDEHNEIAYVCRLDEGKRLVSVLSTHALFNQRDIRDALSSTEEHKDESMNQDIQSTDLDDNIAQLVVFYLNNQEFAVSIEDVQEITRIPEKLDRVPKTPDFIEGMVNLRGTVMPVIDMRSRFGLTRISSSDRQRIIVMQLNGERTGFIVDSVAQVIRIPVNQIETSPTLSDEQEKMMGRVVNLIEQKRMIQVLDAEALLSECDLQGILEGTA